MSISYLNHQLENLPRTYYAICELKKDGIPRFKELGLRITALFFSLASILSLVTALTCGVFVVGVFYIATAVLAFYFSDECIYAARHYQALPYRTSN